MPSSFISCQKILNKKNKQNLRFRDSLHTKQSINSLLGVTKASLVNINDGALLKACAFMALLTSEAVITGLLKEKENRLVCFPLAI